MFVDQKTGFRILKEIVAERPNWVDPDAVIAKQQLDAGEDEDELGGCVYAKRDGDDLVPSCLVGVWVERVRGDLGALELTTDNASVALEAAGIETTDAMVVALQGAQAFQDKTEPWASSLDWSLRAVAEFLRLRKQSGTIETKRNIAIANVMHLSGVGVGW